jgi:hypothetical protein
MFGVCGRSPAILGLTDTSGPRRPHVPRTRRDRRGIAFGACSSGEMPAGSAWPACVSLRDLRGHLRVRWYATPGNVCIQGARERASQAGSARSVAEAGKHSARIYAPAYRPWRSSRAAVLRRSHCVHCSSRAAASDIRRCAKPGSERRTRMTYRRLPSLLPHRHRHRPRGPGPGRRATQRASVSNRVRTATRSIRRAEPTVHSRRVATPGLNVGLPPLEHEPARAVGQEQHPDPQGDGGHGPAEEHPAPALHAGEDEVDEVREEDADRDRELEQRD